MQYIDHRVSAPGPIAIRMACDWILEGDLDRARQELGPNYTLAPWQAEWLRDALLQASVKFNAPHLAERDVLAI